MQEYPKRWTIEPSFRDTKGIRFGIGLFLLQISRPHRRGRLLLLNLSALQLLAILLTAGKELGMDRHLKSNTNKPRTHSLFRQDCMHYEFSPDMPQVRVRPLMPRFSNLIRRSNAIQRLGVVS